MEIKVVIKSQYRASLAMLQQAVEQCPESLWLDDSYVNPFWRVAYHALIYTHFYLGQNEEAFIPWDKHKEGMQLLGAEAPDATPFSREEVLTYLAHCLKQVEIQVDTMDLNARSGFDWLPFDKLQLQFYNIRHVQQHTGELSERLGAHGEIEVGWVGMK